MFNQSYLLTSRRGSTITLRVPPKVPSQSKEVQASQGLLSFIPFPVRRPKSSSALSGSGSAAVASGGMEGAQIEVTPNPVRRPKSSSAPSGSGSAAVASGGMEDAQVEVLPNLNGRQRIASCGATFDDDEEDYYPSEEEQGNYRSPYNNAEDSLDESGAVIADTQRLLESQYSDLTGTSTPHHRYTSGEQRLHSNPRQYQESTQHWPQQVITTINNAIL
jgi:hypothetical protein